MSSDRSRREGKRYSYREDSNSADEKTLTDDATEDEYAGEEQPDSEDEHLAASDQDVASDESDAAVPAKKRKPVADVLTPSKRAKPALDADQWDGGVQRVIIKLVGAPQSGHVPAGQISPNLLNFLHELQMNNDRDWFSRFDAVYRYALKNFNDFVEAMINDFVEKVDPTVPWLPVKDVVYRIYRDVRFSNDKTPYKTNLMASLSRGGRKGPFAGYHVMIKPGGKSFFAAGRWQPEKQDLAEIRRHLLENTSQAVELKAAVAAPSFVKLFGSPKPTAKGRRSSLWGSDDELKVAPKIAGVTKAHPDIDWLKLRSFCAIHNFTDREVLAENFRERLIEAGIASEPLVSILNSMTHPDPPPPQSENDQDSELGGSMDDDASENEESALEYDDADEE